MKKSQLWPAVFVAAATLMVAGCSATAPTDDEPKEDIVIGFSAPLTGGLAESGQALVDGAEIAVEQINANGGILDGRQIRLEIQDEQGSPETAAAGMRALKDKGIDLVAGMFSSALCLAVAPTLESIEMVLVAAGCVNDAVAGRPGQPAPYANLFRVANNDSALVNTLSDTVAERFPEFTNYSAFAYDYVTGHAHWDLYQSNLADAGIDITIDSETFIPIGELDYGLQIQNLISSASGDPETSALYLGTFGAGTGSFLQQAESYDLESKFGLIVTPGGYYSIARTLNGTAPTVWNAYDYNYSAYDNELNTAFVEAAENKLGVLPNEWVYDAYLTILTYAAAIEKAGSTDREAVKEALAGISFEAPSGTLTLDAKTHQLDNPVVVMNTVGDPKSPEGVKMIETIVVDNPRR